MTYRSSPVPSGWLVWNWTSRETKGMATAAVRTVKAIRISNTLLVMVVLSKVLFPPFDLYSSVSILEIFNQKSTFFRFIPKIKGLTKPFKGDIM